MKSEKWGGAKGAFCHVKWCFLSLLCFKNVVVGGMCAFFSVFGVIFSRKSLAVCSDVRTFASAFAPKTGFGPRRGGMFFERFS